MQFISSSGGGFNPGFRETEWVRFMKCTRSERAVNWRVKNADFDVDGPK